MNTEENQLILQYVEEKKRKRKKVLLSFFLLFMFIASGFVGMQILEELEGLKVEKEEEVVIPSILKLTTDNIEVYEYDSIEYDIYIKEAKVANKDVSGEVKWSTIDTSKKGTYYIVYSLSDKEKKIVERKLKVVIKEKPKEEVIEQNQAQTPVVETQPKQPEQNTQNQGNTQQNATQGTEGPKVNYPVIFYAKDYPNHIDGAENACYTLMRKVGGGCYDVRNETTGDWLYYQLLAE